MPLSTTGPTPPTGPAAPPAADGSSGGIVTGAAAGAPPPSADLTPWPADPHKTFTASPDMGKVDP